ncbi:MAG: DUF3124 domain-containing protein [Saprospiraceae bacterium]
MQSCENSNPNLNKEGKDILEANEIYADNINLNYQDTVYVPIYSDIYAGSKYITFNLTATLSIRNTSLTDSMYVEAINYYNTGGELVQEFLDKTLVLRPMQSIEYVIDEDDETGGTGANFIVHWGAMNDRLIPVIQGVMISTHRQQGISFVTEGVSISKRQ